MADLRLFSGPDAGNDAWRDGTATDQLNSPGLEPHSEPRTAADIEAVTPTRTSTHGSATTSHHFTAAFHGDSTVDAALVTADAGDMSLLLPERCDVDRRGKLMPGCSGTSVVLRQTLLPLNNFGGATPTSSMRSRQAELGALAPRHGCAWVRAGNLAGLWALELNGLYRWPGTVALIITGGDIS